MNTDFDNEKQLDAALKEFRASACAGLQRPEDFWEKQRRAVMAQIVHRPQASPFKPLLVWGIAVAVVLIAFGLWVEGPRTLPAPDFAAGYDQDLLGDVESLTNAEAPLALGPAFILADEIKTGAAQLEKQATRTPRQ